MCVGCTTLLIVGVIDCQTGCQTGHPKFSPVRRSQRDLKPFDLLKYNVFTFLHLSVVLTIFEDTSCVALLKAFVALLCLKRFQIAAWFDGFAVKQGLPSLGALILGSRASPSWSWFSSEPPQSHSVAALHLCLLNTSPCNH